MKENYLEIKSRDGTPLRAILATPHEDTRGAVVLAHGITVEKNEDGFYTELAELLAAKGLQSLRFDFRGHGESGGRPEEMTIAGEIDDLAAAVNHLLKLGWPKVAVIGTSFGAGIAVLYAQRSANIFSSLVLLAPVLDYQRTFLEPETEWAIECFTKEAFDRAEITGILDLEGFPLGQALIQEFKTLDPGQTLLNLTVPTLIVHGTEDSMVPYDVAQHVGSTYQHGKFLPIEGADHGFEDFTDQVFTEVTKWIIEHL